MTESTTKSQTTTATFQGETSPTMLTSEQGTSQTDSTTLTSANIQTIQTLPTSGTLLTEAPPKQHDLLNNFGITFKYLTLYATISKVIASLYVLYLKCYSI